MADVVEILLRMRNARAFERDADNASKSVAGIGTSAEKAGEKGKRSWKNMAKWAGGAAAFAATGKFLKDSVRSTEELSKNTIGLQRATGMDVKTSSEWAAILKTRDVSTKQFQVSMVKLSKTLNDARGGSKKAAETLDQLGVSQEAITKGDVGGAILQAADGLSKMTNPAQKAALAQAAFGRSAAALRPLLDSGSAGIQEQLDLADKLGVSLGTKNVEGTKKLIASQRMLQLAFMGLQVKLGTALLPAIETVVEALAKFAEIIQPVLRNSTALQIILGTLVVAFIAYKAAVVASTIATLGLTAATWASIGIWVLVVAGIIAVGVALVVLYKKCTWFRNAVNAVWAAIKTAFSAMAGFIRQHWRAMVIGLAGPLGAATVLIIDHFRDIKKVVNDVVHYVADRFRELIAFLKRVPGAITDALGGAFDFVKGLPGGAVGAVKGAFASGGTAGISGRYLVGERGPEVVTLARGQSVMPVPNIAPVGLDGGGASQTIVTQVYLDRRQIAEAVGTYASDRLARR